MNEDMNLVIDYYLDMALDDTRPLDILLALCRLKWPEHKGWRSRDEEDNDDGLYYLSNVVDEEGIRASDLLCYEDFKSRVMRLVIRKIGGPLKESPDELYFEMGYDKNHHIEAVADTIKGLE